MDTITIRASSLPELFDCPARWEAKYIRKLHLPGSGAAQLGTAVHAGAAAFDAATLEGNPLTPDDAAGAVVDVLHRPKAEVAWEDGLTPQSAEKIALALHGRYCREIAPRQIYIGVEVTCERVEITDIGLAFTGTTDRVRVTESGEIGITDIKTGARAVGSDGKVDVAPHLAQLGVYEILASQALGAPVTAPAQIVGMQTGKTSTAQRVAHATADTRIALVGDEERPGLLQMASRMLHAGLFYGNPRSYLCGAKYCPAFSSCRFRG